MTENEIYRHLKAEKEFLETEIKRIREHPIEAPEGVLFAAVRKSRAAQYYIRKPGGKGGKEKRIYLKAGERDVAGRIAQREYQEKALRFMEKRLNQICRTLKTYEKSLEDIFLRMPKGKQLLVRPVVQPLEEYENNWKASLGSEQNGYEIVSRIFSEKGEHVRSKSEKIIADKLYYLGIPYVYEPKLELNRTSSVFPDFAILNRRTRQTLFYEHFGMMDDPEYAAKTVRKLKDYEAAGYWFGKNLLYSFETQNDPMDSRLLEEMLRTYCM